MKNKNQVNSKNSFIISSGMLLRALKEMKYTIGKNPVLPILEDVCFKIKGADDSNNAKCELSATDLENSSIRLIDCEAHTDFSFCVPFVQLVKFLSSIDEQPLTITCDTEKMNLKILGSELTCNLTTENADDFPRIPIVEEYFGKLTVTEEIVADIEKAIHFLNKDTMRPAQTGVCFDFRADQKKMIIAATDAHQLFRAEYEYEGNVQRKFIVPAALAKQITDEGILTFSKEVNDEGEESSHNVLYTHHAFREVGGIRYESYQREEISRLIDANFPDVDVVIPASDDYVSVLKFNRDTMMKSLKQLIPFANKNTTQINFALNRAIQMSANDLDFSQSVQKTIDGKLSSGELEIAFNGNFLSNVLSNYDADEVHCELTTSSRAAKFIEGDKTYILMPIQINA